ncbi:hypothetical protein CPB85DRAFT_1278566 [Mucidula mucida]|nr:hypothetical protein CPB85DRAFT_1278566 [Mucidula mucida]
MSSGATAQDKAWKSKEQADEAQYAHNKEQEQLATLREKLESEKPKAASTERDFEGGFGGQEDLEDRFATTSGEH